MHIWPAGILFAQRTATSLLRARLLFIQALPVPTSAAALIALFPGRISSSALLPPFALSLGLVFSSPLPSAILVYSEGQDPCKEKKKIEKKLV